MLPLPHNCLFAKLTWSDCRAANKSNKQQKETERKLGDILRVNAS